jgi:hypothetical protein
MSDKLLINFFGLIISADEIASFAERRGCLGSPNLGAIVAFRPPSSDLESSSSHPYASRQGPGPQRRLARPGGHSHRTGNQSHDSSSSA